jgi:alpha-glucosidase (family GH31 glycosyl hydrolase)
MDEQSVRRGGDARAGWRGVVQQHACSSAELRAADRRSIYSAAHIWHSPLQYEDQYLEWSTQLPLKPALYGLGERVSRLQLPVNQTYSLYARDRGTPQLLNLYGVHPFYLEMR